MKILIISDSHYKSIYCFDLSSYDLVIHCGDIKANDYDLLSLENNIKYVKGNCDYFAINNLEEVFIFKDHTFYITHSHIYQTKEGLNNLVNKTKGLYNCVCFGHTHMQTYFKEGDTCYINPGSLMEGNYAEIIDDTLYFYAKKNLFSKKDSYKVVKKVKNIILVK